ncbi:meiosis-specific kinetochore protein isoform X2 [Rhineura floridana]|nr:meiosis-specific kinetochore protein isoform X2 [Rhineura floridana]
MDWIKLRSYSRKRQAQKNVHCASPVPGVAASAAAGRRNVKAKGLRPDLLSEPRRDRVKRHIGNASTKGLPKIHEISEVTQMGCPSAEQSVELNYNKNRSMDVNKDINEMDPIPLKDSLHLNSSSKESLRNSETTSGMTLPTGLSGFLLECLDEDSTLGCNTESSDGASSYSSPEIFRDERDLEGSSTSSEVCLGHRNSTLLDTSKAINIDRMPHLPNLSKILETTLGGQDQSVMSDRQSKQKLHSKLTNASTVVAGKQVCKVLSAKEKTPELQSSGASLLSLKRKKQTDDQPQKMKCRKKVLFKSGLESTSSSSSPDVLNPSGKSMLGACCGITDKILVSSLPDTDVEIGSRTVNMRKNKALLTSTALQQPEDLELDLSSVHKVSLSEDFLLNTNSSYVNSEEIVPASLSPESIIRQCLRNPPEICSVIKASPGFRPLNILQHPLNRKVLFPPPGATEDIITSSKNWVYNSDR